jgi:hypothetical protein
MATPALRRRRPSRRKAGGMAVLAAAIPATVSRATPTISAESQDANTPSLGRRRPC